MDGRKKTVKARAKPHAAPAAKAAPSEDAKLSPDSMGGVRAPLSSEDAEFYRKLFHDSADAHFVLDGRTGTFCLVNRRFVETTGYSEEELVAGNFRPTSLVYGKGREMAEEQIRGLKEGASGIFEWICADRNGRVWDVEVSVQRFRSKGRPYVLGQIRDIGPRKELERRLKREVELQRKKTIEAAKAGVRVFQLTEKIKRIPELVRRLAAASDEAALFDGLKEGLVGPESMGYAEAALYLVDGRQLLCQFATREMPIKRFHLDKNHKLARIARCGERYYDGSAGELVVPLRRSGEVAGLLQIFFDEEDRLLFGENDTVRSGQENLVEALALALESIWGKLRLETASRDQAKSDSLTGLANRRYFRGRLLEETKRALRYQRDLSLILIGLDRFREINEVWGHGVGDRVLVFMAGYLGREFREIDILSRYGSDEFAVLLPETGLEEAKKKSEDLRYKVERTPVPLDGEGGEKIDLTVSVGVATRTEGMTDPDELLKHCEEALYTAKREGRNQVSSFEDKPRILPKRIATQLE
ncbi:MAG: GGDEF domain-containing protein [Planctomycetes bacterium]|nr:GGDEF domain-containing protein [Planctomycetota bacterium]